MSESIGEIKILEEVETAADIVRMSSDERTAYFEKLAEDTKIRLYTTFGRMLERQLKYEHITARPDIPELMFRALIQMSREYSIEVIPVVSNLRGVTQKRNGGRRPQPALSGFRVRLSGITPAISADGIPYMIPENEEVTVVGVLLREIRDPSKLHKWDALVRYMLFTGLIDLHYISVSTNSILLPTIVNRDHIGETLFSNDLLVSKVYESIRSEYMFHYGFEVASFISVQIIRALTQENELTKYLIAPNEPILPPAEPLDIHPILAEITDIAGVSFIASRPAILATLDELGYLSAYYQAVAKGRDDPSVRTMLSALLSRKKRLMFRETVRKKNLETLAKIKTYEAIIEDKLGGDRAADIAEELQLRPQLLARADGILELLKPAERKLVELEYDQRSKYIEQVLNNKCPHVPAYRRFRAAKTDDLKRKLFNDLKKYMPPGKQDINAKLKCVLCGFDLICPHVKELTEMELANREYSDIKARMSKYIDRTPMRDNYYCRVCGEVISSKEDFGDVMQERDISGAISEDLRTMMWSELLGVVKALKFSSLINVGSLIEAMRNACYPFIFEIEKQIIKSKTNTLEEIKNKKRLYITIYGYAYAILLVTSSKSDVKVEFKDAKIPAGKKQIAALIAYCVDLIMDTKNIIIREIPGMTASMVASKLVDAFKSLAAGGLQTISYSAESEELAVTLLLDPVYKYVYKIGSMDTGKSPGLAKGIDEFLGAPVSKLEKQTDIYEHVYISKFAKWNIDKFNNLQEFKPKDAPAVIDAVTPGYIAESYKLFYERIHGRLHDQSVYISVSLDPPVSKFSDVFEKYFDKCDRFAAKEQVLLDHRRLVSEAAYSKMLALNDRRFISRAVALGRLYDLNGNEHKWNIYVIKTEAGATESLTAAQIAGMAPINFTVIDRKCSVCGSLFSEAEKLDETKIYEAIDAKNTLINFFRFYEMRCPAATTSGGVHEFVDNKCIKCGFDPEARGVLTDMDKVKSVPQQAMDYFAKYKHVYYKERAEFAAAGDSVAAAKVVDAQADYDAKYSAEFANWSFNFNALLTLSKELKININQLTCIGAAEKQEFADITGGKYIPAESTSRYETRTYVVLSYVKNLIKEYNMLRFYHRLARPPAELTNIIDSSGISRHKLAEISELLPAAAPEFNEKFEFFRRNKKPRETTAFCIQTFCEICLNIRNNPDKLTERMRHDFVAYFVAKVLKSDEMITKPGYFSWSLIYGDKEEEEVTPDGNFADDADDLQSPEDMYIEDEEHGEGALGDSAEAFKGLVDFDMEQDPDAEPDDDPSNDIRVSDDYDMT